uniref:Uncharacterized protein n=1 Tax=Oryza rufipogon TaxID=4529 RepID=A0A0E0NCN2_ORYRU
MYGLLANFKNIFDKFTFKDSSAAAKDYEKKDRLALMRQTKLQDLILTTMTSRGHGKKKEHLKDIAAYKSNFFTCKKHKNGADCDC